MKEPRLLTKYRKEVMPAMRDKFGYKSTMAVPRLSKVVVNIGTGKNAKETKLLEKMNKDIAIITGQKPALRKAKKSISGFKLREGTDVGIVATLRGKRMYDFIDRLVSVALPRSRDFHGLDAKSFDRAGNFSLGIKEHNIFPEVSYESLKDIFGFQVTISTTSRNREEGQELLRLMGFPIKT